MLFVDTAPVSKHISSSLFYILLWYFCGQNPLPDALIRLKHIAIKPEALYIKMLLISLGLIALVLYEEAP